MGKVSQSLHPLMSRLWGGGGRTREALADLSLLCLWPFGNSLTDTVHSEFYQCHTQNRSHTLQPADIAEASSPYLTPHSLEPATHWGPRIPASAPPLPYCYHPWLSRAPHQPKMTFKETKTMRRVHLLALQRVEEKPFQGAFVSTQRRFPPSSPRL